MQPALDCDFGFEQMWGFDQIAWNRRQSRPFQFADLAGKIGRGEIELFAEILSSDVVNNSPRSAMFWSVFSCLGR